MDSSEHVFFSGEGAAIFAKKQGFEMKEPEWFYTEKAYKAYLRRSKDLGNEAILLKSNSVDFQRLKLLFHDVSKLCIVFVLLFCHISITHYCYFVVLLLLIIVILLYF